MPQSLSVMLPKAKPIFVQRALSQRPAQAALVAETIATWSYAEHALGRSVAAMSQGINAAEMEDYIKNWQLSKRINKLKNLAKIELVAPYQQTFIKVVETIQSFAQYRNAFAHGVWGHIEDLPNALLLVEPEHIFRHWGKARDWLSAFDEGGPEAAGPITPLDNQFVEVWSNEDLREEIGKMNKVYELALGAESLASNDIFDTANSRRTHTHSLLLKDPLIGG